MFATQDPTLEQPTAPQPTATPDTAVSQRCPATAVAGSCTAVPVRCPYIAMSGSSTGPRTAAGKAKASRNATRHGLLSSAPIATDFEQEADWNAHLADIVQGLAPIGHEELLLAEHLAFLYWRRARLAHYETQQINTGPEDEALALLHPMFRGCQAALAPRGASTSLYADPPGSEADDPMDDDGWPPLPTSFPPPAAEPVTPRFVPEAKAADLIIRYEAHVARDLIRTRREFERLQAARAARAAASVAAPASLACADPAPRPHTPPVLTARLPEKLPNELAPTGLQPAAAAERCPATAVAGSCQPAAAAVPCPATAVAGSSQPAATALRPSTPGTAVPVRCPATAVAGSCQPAAAALRPSTLGTAVPVRCHATAVAGSQTAVAGLGQGEIANRTARETSPHRTARSRRAGKRSRRSKRRSC